MNSFYFLVVFLIGFISGKVYTKYRTIKDAINAKKVYNDELESIFSELLKKVDNFETVFKTRLNNSICFTTNLSKYGNVSVLYIYNEHNLPIISIHLDDVCVASSTYINNNNLISKLSYSINFVHRNEISDVVDILGIKLYRKDFEKSLNSIESSNNDLSDIIETNKNNLDLDEILDKINKVGLSKLSKEEKDFLNNYNKK